MVRFDTASIVCHASAQDHTTTPFAFCLNHLPRSRHTIRASRSRLKSTSHSQRKRRGIPSEVFRPAQNQGQAAHAKSGACSPCKLRGMQPTQTQGHTAHAISGAFSPRKYRPVPSGLQGMQARAQRTTRHAVMPVHSKLQGTQPSPFTVNNKASRSGPFVLNYKARSQARSQ
jgi:hypothetical protein